MITPPAVFPVINFSHFSTGKYSWFCFSCLLPSQTERVPDPSFHHHPSAFARVAAFWATFDFSLRRVRGFCVFRVPTASSCPAKPSNLSSARRGPFPSLVASRANLLLRTRGHVPFYPINPINFSRPVSLYFFPMISPRLLPPLPSVVGPSSVFGEKKKRTLRRVWVPPGLAVPSAGSHVALQPFPFPPLPRGGGGNTPGLFFFWQAALKSRGSGQSAASASRGI